MARAVRGEVIVSDEVGVYHCVQRCVRRAWLCGDDPYSGKNYDHRKVLIQQRLQFLAGQFGIDVCAYAVMTNHLHVVLRNRPDVVKTWSDEEVARRWWNLFPKRKEEDGSPSEPRQHELDMLMAGKKALTEKRERLSSISWFMRCLAEVIARKANKEDECTGRFWEGRFKCQPLLDETAVLACSMYVDLNPVRAGAVKTPETSEFTSAHDRIHARSARKAAQKKPKQPRKKKRYKFGIVPRDNWLAPIEIDERKIGPDVSKTKKRASNKGYLPLSRDDYLTLLDWTGRQIAGGKRGTIPAELAPIMERIGIPISVWVDTVMNFKRTFLRAAGMPSSLQKEAERRGQYYLQSRFEPVSRPA